jgi:hypothetical protein
MRLHPNATVVPTATTEKLEQHPDTEFPKPQYGVGEVHVIG